MIVRFRSSIAPMSFFFTVLCVLAAPVGAAAQEAPQASFGEVVDVRVVNVDVVVTDRDGTPVTGLGKDDFELVVDGRPVAITNFYASEQRVARPEGIDAATSERSTVSAPARAETEPPRRLIVWIDDLSLAPANRRRVLRQLGEFLDEQQRLGTEILLLRFDRTIEVVRPFTERRRRLSDDLAEIEQRATSGTFLESGRREMMREIQEIRARDGCANASDMEFVARRLADPLRGDVLSGLEGLRGWVRSLAGLDGRKALLYVSDGIPIEPGQEGYLLIDQLCNTNTAWSNTGSVVNQVRDVAAAANAAGVTFYTLDAAGLPVAASADASVRGLDAGFLQLVRGNYQDALQNLASETGGRTLLDSNRIAPLVAALASDFEAYYSLGFTPEGEPDGRAHAIDVRLRQANLLVRHRTGFSDRPAAERASDRLLSALHFGGADPSAVKLEIGAVRGLDAKTASLSVELLFPAAGLAFLPEEGGAKARIELVVVASDAEGRLAPEQRLPLVIARESLPEDLARATVRVPFDLALRRGRGTVAVAIRDLVGGGEAIVRRDVLVR